MDERAEIGGRTYATAKCMFPSQSLYVTFSQKRVSRAHKHVRVSRTKDGARVSIVFLRRGLYSCSASWLHLVSTR